MADSWIRQYIADAPWLENDLLVSREGVKKCENCQQRLFSIDFPDCELFRDQKLPVCLTCFRSRKEMQKVRNILVKHDILKSCKKCKESKPLHEFSHSKPINGIYHTCKKCMSKRFDN